jgi:hypothetical protein
MFVCGVAFYFCLVFLLCLFFQLASGSGLDFLIRKKEKIIPDPDGVLRPPRTNEKRVGLL